MGADRAAIVALARDPFYAALHGLWLLYGEYEFTRRVAEILTKAGVVRVRTIERPADCELVQIGGCS
jgi:hypothetical protein